EDGIRDDLVTGVQTCALPICALAVDLRELEVFIVKALLDAGLGRLLAHSVVFVGRALYVIHGRVARPLEAWHEHLRQANVFRPRSEERRVGKECRTQWQSCEE